MTDQKVEVVVRTILESLIGNGTVIGGHNGLSLSGQSILDFQLNGGGAVSEVVVELKVIEIVGQSMRSSTYQLMGSSIEGF